MPLERVTRIELAFSTLGNPKSRESPRPMEQQQGRWRYKRVRVAPGLGPTSYLLPEPSETTNQPLEHRFFRTPHQLALARLVLDAAHSPTRADHSLISYGFVPLGNCRPLARHGIPAAAQTAATRL